MSLISDLEKVALVAEQNGFVNDSKFLSEGFFFYEDRFYLYRHDFRMSDLEAERNSLMDLNSYYKALNDRKNYKLINKEYY